MKLTSNTTISLIRYSAFIIIIAAICPATVQAIPLLQLYIEGSLYDTTDESWIMSSQTDTIRVWTIGNVSAQGGKGPISDVRMSIAYSTNQQPTFAITSSSTNNFGSYHDPSVPDSPTLLTPEPVSDGSNPQTGNKTLPQHGIYGSETSWIEYALGDFTRTDSQISNFIDTFPTAPEYNGGQINVYEISINGLSVGDMVHFDLYGKIKQKSIFAPFSHDAAFSPIMASSPEPVPEPATFALMIIGLAYMVSTHTRSKK